jgi:hypothetical protein
VIQEHTEELLDFVDDLDGEVGVANVLLVDLCHQLDKDGNGKHSTIQGSL